MIKLSESFLHQYQGKQPKWGFDGLGFIVYLRTYSRTKPDGTLEEWWETCQRVTEGNFNLEKERLEELGKWDSQREKTMHLEMERFYHLLFNLVITPPGRGLWMSGTEYEKKIGGDALNNCWGVSMRPHHYKTGKSSKVSFTPCFTFDQAMKGGGVGVNIQKKHVDLIPKVNNSVNLAIICDPEHADFHKMSDVIPITKNTMQLIGDSEYSIYYKVEDSREGWGEALRKVIDSHFEGNKHLIINISDVRPEGEPIKGFGGTASGPPPLVKMLHSVNNILNKNEGRKVTPTEWGDVIQLIGNCVVAGNVRRTALILIGDMEDREFVESKNYSLPQNQQAATWRWASNNSVDVSSKFTREQFEEIAKHIYYNGEPGYVNTELARNYGRTIDGYQEDIDKYVEIFNPCGEVPLSFAENCNLFEINLPRIEELVQRGEESPELYKEACYLGARYAYRVTFKKYEWEATEDIVSKNRRIGVGITGITDWALIKFNKQFDEEAGLFLDSLYKEVRETNLEQAKDLEGNKSIKVTTVKPSGTVSILMGVSPGQHYHWSPYMIRRVRIASNSPLVSVLEQCGYHVEVAITGFSEDGSPIFDEGTKVVSFPIKAPTAGHPEFMSAKEVPLEDQAKLQALLQTYWADNSVSATLSFNKPKPKPVFFEDGSQLYDKMGKPILQVNPKHEQRVIENIADILNRYSGTIKSTTMLPHATGTYPQMPYEEITREKYEEMRGKIVANPWDIMGIAVPEEGELDESMECVGGACPLR